MQTFLRRLEILNFLALQRTARKTATGTDAIVEHLRDSGYLEVGSDNRRSQFRLIQRDMQFLLGEEIDGEYENDFGLKAIRGEGKSLLWSLEPYESVSYDFERMPAYMALAMNITQKHLQQVLPKQTRQELAIIFEGAEAKLQKADTKLSRRHYLRLTQAVEFYQRGQSLQAPEYKPDILDSIYQAILMGRRVEIEYRSGTTVKPYSLHPYGVAIMLPKLYLIAKKTEPTESADISDKQDSLDVQFRSFLVHKIESVRISPFSNNVPEQFELKAFLEQGYMDVMIEGHDRNLYQLHLELHVAKDSNLLMDLKDSPLSHDQRLEQIDADCWHLHASVRRTVQLRNWLLSLGAQARVLAPQALREDLTVHLEQIMANYQ